jgi:hypothetical protein
MWKNRQFVVVKTRATGKEWKIHKWFDPMEFAGYGQVNFDPKKAHEEAEEYVRLLVSSGQFTHRR